MIEITATVASLEQGRALLDAGVDTLYFGMEAFGLRLPHSFTWDEQSQLIDLAHAAGKKATVAVNGIMHPEKMKEIPDYLKFLKASGVDQITLGDPGIIYAMKKNNCEIPFLYDGQTLVTSSRQINFWSDHGAIGAVVAREVPFAELEKMAPNLHVFGEVQVFGPTCIHQSKRPLLQNYFNYTKVDVDEVADRELFLSEPKKPETHYGIFEDSNGTHVFADNDLNLLPVLPKLATLSYDHWKLDGLFTPENDFVEVVEQFVEARHHLEKNIWSQAVNDHLTQEVRRWHPAKRGLDLGFFEVDPASVQ